MPALVGDLKPRPDPAALHAQAQRTLAKIAEQVAAGKLAYNKFFAIGLFR